MRFKRTFSLVVVVSTFVAHFGCGEKKAAERTLLPGRDVGCYDALGERVGRFFEGAIENPEWQATFECVDDQVSFFKKYVRGNVPDGYNRADIAALIRKFLIVKTPVSDQFVASIFDIKASVFGGSATVITPAEIDQFLKLSEVLRKETTALLPHLQAKHRLPSGANLLKLSDQVGIFGVKLGNYLRTLRGTVDVRKESFLPFVREIIAIHGGDASLVERYGTFVRNLKVVVTGGNSEVIEAGTWSTLIQEGAAIGGLLFAYRDMEEQLVDSGEKDLFQVDLSRQAQKVINRIINHHGTGIPLELFDPIIDTLPWNGLSKEKRLAIKHDLRPIIARALKGGVPGWLNAKAVATVIDLFEDGMRHQVHLKRIYAGLGTNPQKKDFEVAARKYLNGIAGGGEREEVNTLIGIAKSYVGLFPDNSGKMVFTNQMRETRTKNHMIRMSWFRIIMGHAFSAYATGPEGDSGQKTARKEDLSFLTQDFYQILLNWKLAHPEMTTIQMAEKRFREANLFMPTSNGDAYMDESEGIYYLAFLFSAGSFSGQTFRDVTANSRDWSACPIVGYDELHQAAVEARCFRDVYFGNPDVFWVNFPGLQAAYAKLSAQKQIELAESMEKAARRGGYSEKPIGPYDVDSFAALPHYVEDLVERFDTNDDEVLDKREILDHAYPIFKDTLAGAAPSAKGDLLLKGILTYIIKYGRAPKGTLDLLAWVARLPITKVEADRAALYRVVALLSSPLELDKNVNGSSWPIGEPNLFPTVNGQ